MTYQTVELPLVGGSNPNRDRSSGQDRTLNLYPEMVGANRNVLLPWPGATPFTGLDNLGDPRGFYETSDGRLFKVIDTNLLQIDNLGNETVIGTILGNAPVIMSDNGDDLFLATDNIGYIYSDVITQLGVGYEAGGSVDFMNERTVWKGFGQRWVVSEPGQPATFNPLDYATAESSGDDLLRVYVFREVLYLLGSKTIEPWYDRRDGGFPPFERINNGKIDVGLISKLAVSSNDNHLYWLGDDKNLYRTAAYSPEPLMPASIHFEISKYDLNNAQIKCLTHSGQFFVLILTDNVTYLYSETTGAWIELGYKTDNQIYLAYSYAYAFNKHLIISRIDGRVHELSFDHYTDNGLPVLRERITQPFSLDGDRFTFKRAELVMQSGVGNTSEVRPLIKMSHSIDFGQSWSNEQYIEAGRDSDNNIRIEYYAMANCRQIQFRIRTTDPNFISFQRLKLDVGSGGRF